MNLTLASAHTLKIDVHLSVEVALDDCLKRFWDLESLGIAKEELSFCVREVYPANQSLTGGDIKYVFPGRNVTLHSQIIVSCVSGD